MAKRTYRIKDLVKELGKSERTIRQALRDGKLGPCEAVGGEWVLDEKAIDRYLRGKHKKIMVVNPKADRKAQKEMIKDNVMTYKYSREECQKRAREKADKFVEEHFSDKGLSNEEIEQERNKKFDKYFEEAMITCEFIPKKKPANDLQKREALEMPLDVESHIKIYDPNEREFFTNQYRGYVEKGYDMTDSTTRVVIQVMIDQQIRLLELGKLLKLARHYRDSDLEEMLDKAQKRFLDLSSALGEAHSEDNEQSDRTEQQMRKDLRNIT